MKTLAQWGAKGDGLTDDTAALRAWAMAGGGDIPAGQYVVTGDIPFPSGFTISSWAGTIRYRRGQPSGHLFHPMPGATGGLRINATGHNHIVYDGPSDLPRKGIGIRGTPTAPFTDFEVHGVNVVGGAAPKGINLFGFEVLHAAKGLIADCYSSVKSGQQGSDGCKIHGMSSDIEVARLSTDSGDDSVSVTQEAGNGYGACTAERIYIHDCSLGNDGHAALKLKDNISGGIVRGVRALNNDYKTKPSAGGAGTVIWIENDNGIIEAVEITGIARLIGAGPNPTDPFIKVQGASGSIKLRSAIANSRVPVAITNAPNFTVDLGKLSQAGRWKAQAAPAGCSWVAA